MPNSTAKDLGPGHWERFKVWYEDPKMGGRTKSFPTRAEADRFIDTLSEEATYRLDRIETQILRLK